MILAWASPFKSDNRGAAKVLIFFQLFIKLTWGPPSLNKIWEKASSREPVVAAAANLLWHPCWRQQFLIDKCS